MEEQQRQHQHHQQQQPRIVLTEEEYTDTLSNIIQRDFFPQVPELERQAAILERRAANDFVGAVAVRRAARRLQQHEQALADQEEFEEYQQEGEQDGCTNNNNNNSVAGNATRRRVTARPLHRETVTGFHARVTNADNAEFDQQQREELLAARERLEQVFHGNMKRQNLLKLTNGADNDQPPAASATPLLASDAYNASPHRLTAAEWKPTSIQNGFFFTPSTNNNHLNEKVDNSSESVLLLTNSGSAPSLSSIPTTLSLMPPPAPKTKGSDLALTNSSLSSKEQQYKSLLDQKNLVEYKPKHMLEKKIEPSRTRFPTTSLLSRHDGLQALDSRAATADNNSATEDYATDASSSTDLDAPPRSLEHERQSRNKRQRRELERLVTMTPLLAPGRDGVSASPIMTWGEISSTPLVLGGGGAAAVVAFAATASTITAMDEPNRRSSATLTTTTTATTEPSFAIPAPSERDQRAAKAQSIFAELARKRVSASSSSSSSSRLCLSSSRSTAATASSTPMSRLQDSLTPAARSLLEKMTTATTSSTSASRLSMSSTPRSRDAFGTALRASYSSSTNINNRTPQRYGTVRTTTATTATPGRNTSNRIHKSLAPDRTSLVTAEARTGATAAETTSGHPTDGLLRLNGL